MIIKLFIVSVKHFKQWNCSLLHFSFYIIIVVILRLEISEWLNGSGKNQMKIKWDVLSDSEQTNSEQNYIV